MQFFVCLININYKQRKTVDISCSWLACRPGLHFSVTTDRSKKTKQKKQQMKNDALVKFDIR